MSKVNWREEFEKKFKVINELQDYLIDEASCTDIFWWLNDWIKDNVQEFKQKIKDCIDE